MAAPACPSCGNINPPGTDKCLKCGTVLPSEFKTSVCPNCKNVNPVGAIMCVKCGHELPENYPIPLIINKEAEKKGLSFLKLAGITIMLGAILIYVVPIVSWSYYGSGLNISSFPPSTTDIVPPVPQWLSQTLQALVIVGFAFLGAGWITFGLGFQRFAAVDPGYKAAMFSAFIGLISVFLIAGAAALDIQASTNYFNCLSSNPGNPGGICNPSGNTANTIYWLWAFSIMFFIFGGIGVFIGMFRLGARYLTPTYWISGFLMIFPVLVMIGAIVLILAAVSSEKRLESWEKFGVRDASSVAVAPPAAV